MIWGGAELAPTLGGLAGRISGGGGVAKISGVWEKPNSGSPTHSVAVVVTQPGSDSGSGGFRGLICAGSCVWARAGLPQGLSSCIVLASLWDWCGPPPQTLICGWALCPGWEALTKLGGLGQWGLSEGRG